MKKLLDGFGLLLKVALGVVLGAFVGANAGIIVTLIYLFGFHSTTHAAEFDQSGLGALPLAGSQIGAILGATLFAIVFARLR